jgi:hypothetical protein
VGVDGPFNEHLVRDVGALYLAGVLALMWREWRVTLLVAAAWVTFSVPHLGYHLNHLDVLDTVDVVGNVIALGGTLALAVLLLVSVASRKEVAR